MKNTERRLINKLMYGALEWIRPDNVAHIKLNKDEINLIYKSFPDTEIEFVMSCEFCDELLTRLGVEERFT